MEKTTNGFIKTRTIVTLVVGCIILLGAIGNAFIKIGKAQERIDNLESAGASLKAELVEMSRRQRNTEINTYAIAVKLGVEGIIKPVDK